MAIGTTAAGAYAATQNLISSVGTGAGGGLGAGRADPVAGAGGGFGALLERAMDGIAETGKKAEGQAMAVASGKADLVDVVTAVAESETALQTVVALRDRMIAAYEDVMRMQIYP